MSHLLVTNDFPPKIGGIQNYLWELWRRLPPGTATVLTTPYRGHEEFDAAAPLRIVRSPRPVLLPTPGMFHEIDALARAVGASLIVLDPALPLGALGPALAARGHRYVVVLHGAEVTVPGRLPGSRQALARVLRGATHTIAAGNYPLAEGERAVGHTIAATVIPPGVETTRWRPLLPDERRSVRMRFGIAADAPLVVSTSRLVRRKGMDTLIAAADRLRVRIPDLVVAIGGDGRDRDRLDVLVKRGRADVRLLGRLSDDDLMALVGAGDVYAMCCRDRWGGLEQEGFGIVFLEAAAAGVVQVAGESGGSAEAVDDGVTGLVVGRPVTVDAVAAALELLLGDPRRREEMGEAGRRRAIETLSYDVLAARLATVLARLEAQH